MNLVPRVSGFKIVMKSCSVKRCKKKSEKRARTGERQRQGHRPRSRVVRVLPVFKIVRSRDPLSTDQDRITRSSRGLCKTTCRGLGREPFNQNSDRSDREKRTTSKGGPVFSKLFRLDRTDPLSFDRNFRKFWLNGSRPWPQLFKMWTTLSVIGFPNTYPLDGDLSGG